MGSSCIQTDIEGLPQMPRRRISNYGREENVGVGFSNESLSFPNDNNGSFDAICKNEFIANKYTGYDLI